MTAEMLVGVVEVIDYRKLEARGCKKEGREVDLLEIRRGERRMDGREVGWRSEVVEI